MQHLYHSHFLYHPFSGPPSSCITQHSGVGLSQMIFVASSAQACSALSCSSAKQAPSQWRHQVTCYCLMTTLCNHFASLNSSVFRAFHGVHKAALALFKLALMPVCIQSCHMRLWYVCLGVYLPLTENLAKYNDPGAYHQASGRQAPLSCHLCTLHGGNILDSCKIAAVRGPSTLCQLSLRLKSINPGRVS